MKASTMFPSEFLRAGDLDGPKLYTMTSVEMRDIGGDHKPVLFFQETEKGVILNKTNNNTIVQAYGDETEGWAGKQIVLYPSETDYQGKRVACIRMRKPKAAQKPIQEELNDEVPF